ncbi:MAG: polymer-forming cytoskeletal protein [Myxococcota bacterium]
MAFPGRSGSEAAFDSSAGVGSLTAFIDQGSEFSGKLSFRDTVRIDGRFEGEISSDNTLIVGESGTIDANIRSEIVIVSGEVHGDIFASRQVVLHKTARVLGSIDTQSLVIEDGAQLSGSVQMGVGVGGRKDAKDPESSGASRPDPPRSKSSS